MSSIKTNACRLLDQAGIKYQLITYQFDENDLSATHVAQTIGEDVKQVFKTLVLRGDKSGIFVCIIPGNEEVNLKKAAKISGNKSCEMIHVRELLALTGYIRGGCSPIGMKKTYPMYIDETCILFDEIFISAGQRGAQLKINTAQLITFAKLTIAELV